MIGEELDVHRRCQWPDRRQPPRRRDRGTSGRRPALAGATRPPQTASVSAARNESWPCRPKMSSVDEVDFEPPQDGADAWNLPARERRAGRSPACDHGRSYGISRRGRPSRGPRPATGCARARVLDAMQACADSSPFLVTALSPLAGNLKRHVHARWNHLGIDPARLLSRRKRCRRRSGGTDRRRGGFAALIHRSSHRRSARLILATTEHGYEGTDSTLASHPKR